MGFRTTGEANFASEAHPRNFTLQAAASLDARAAAAACCACEVRILDVRIGNGRQQGKQALGWELEWFCPRASQASGSPRVAISARHTRINQQRETWTLDTTTCQYWLTNSRVYSSSNQDEYFGILFNLQKNKETAFLVGF